MLKFFRQIRYDLMKQNKTSKYLKYAIGEIVLVVIGILIALQLNVFKENYQIASERKEYYSQLIEDLNSDKKTLEDHIARIDSFKVDYTAYLETFKGKDLDLEIMTKNIFQVKQAAHLINFNTSTFESLEKSGDIKIFSKDIRNKLLQLKSQQDLLVEIVTNNSIIQADFIKNYFSEIGTGSLSKRISRHPKLTEVLNPEINNAKGILALESNLQWKFVTEQSRDYKKLQSEIEALSDLIHKELEK